MNKETIESYIIDILIKSPLPRLSIVRKAMKQKSVTKEAVYKSLRLLLMREVVVKSGKNISLSNQWIINMAKKWQEAEARYIGKTNIMMLGEKSSVVYTCKTIDQIDSLWNHAILDISYTLHSKTTLLLYAPHYWFPLIRGNSEHSLIKTLSSRGHRWLQLAGGENPIDKNLIKYDSLKGLEYYASKLKENKYLNILGDYIIEVTLDKKASAFIDAWYKTHEKINEDAISALQKVLAIKGTYKIKIYKNQNKATFYKKMFSKYFLIK